MATNFPSSLDNLTNPTASDKLNSVTVPHATQHANVNDAVEALEAKVGVDGSAVTSSHDYILTNGVLPTLNVDSGVLVVDDTNNRVGVNDATPSYALDVTGDINATGDLRIGGTAIGEWTSFTPTWTATGTNPSAGDATIDAKYSIVGDVVTVYYRFLMGSTTTFGTGVWLISTPVTGVQPAANSLNGFAYYLDSNVSTWYNGTVTFSATGDVIVPRYLGSGFGGVGPTVPFSWASNDKMELMLIYEKA